MLGSENQYRMMAMYILSQMIPPLSQYLKYIYGDTMVFHLPQQHFTYKTSDYRSAGCGRDGTCEVLCASAELGLFHVISAFCDTSVPQNGEITRKIQAVVVSLLICWVRCTSVLTRASCSNPIGLPYDMIMEFKKAFDCVHHAIEALHPNAGFLSCDQVT